MREPFDEHLDLEMMADIDACIDAYAIGGGNVTPGITTTDPFLHTRMPSSHVDQMPLPRSFANIDPLQSSTAIPTTTLASGMDLFPQALAAEALHFGDGAEAMPYLDGEGYPGLWYVNALQRHKRRTILTMRSDDASSSTQSPSSSFGSVSLDLASCEIPLDPLILDDDSLMMSQVLDPQLPVDFLFDFNNAEAQTQKPPCGPTSPTTTAQDANRKTSSGAQDLACWDHGCNGRVFSTKSNLRRHQKEKEREGPECYCPKCGAFFSRSTALRQHLANESCNRIRRYSNGRPRPSLLRK